MQLHLGHDFYNIFKIRHNLYSLEVSPPSPNKKKSGCAPRCRTPRVAAQTTKDLHHNKTLQNNKYTLTERFEPTSQVT